MRKLEQSEITNLTKMLIELLSYTYLKSFLTKLLLIKVLRVIFCVSLHFPNNIVI